MVKSLGFPRIYWINLERSIVRRARMQVALDEHGLDAVRVSAVDGQKSVEPYLRSRATEPLVAGCLASHLSAIRTAFAAGEEEAVFMEDDASFELFARFPADFAQLIANLPARWSALWLGYGDTSKHLDELFLRKGLAVPVLRLSLWSTVAYLLHRRAMQHILARYERDGIFDVTSFEGRHEADTLLLRSLASAPELDPPYVLRVPMFTYRGEDSEIHSEELQRQRVARAFVLEAYDALAAGTYVSRFTVEARLSRAASTLVAPFRRLGRGLPR